MPQFYVLFIFVSNYSGTVKQRGTKQHKKAQWQNWQSGRCGAEIKFPYIHNSQPD